MGSSLNATDYDPNRDARGKRTCSTPYLELFIGNGIKW
jgi:hypothetical protein